jgi:DeoR/GlpR family transcriptional regulator of sugar metabolism
MAKGNRRDEIVKIVDEQNYVSVADLSQMLSVSEMTIRRDLAQLDDAKRVHRKFGGAASRRADGTPQLAEAAPADLVNKAEVTQVDVLVATSVDPYYDKLLLDRVCKKNIPIIAESTEMPNQQTLVAVDNYQAGLDLGRWAGEYFRQQGLEQAHLLDLTFHKPNTLNRSRGFGVGLRETCPMVEMVLSISAQSRYLTAYQLTFDALTVYPQINLIFAINDITAWGAINACRDLKIAPERMTLITFGLEGSTLRNELMAGGYCKAGLAMFPEIVSLVCIEAAIAAYNRQPLPEKYVTPHVILTEKTLPTFYTRRGSDWELNWEAARQCLKLPIQIEREKPGTRVRMPRKIGLIVPFIEHEWYRNLTILLKAYAGQYGINLKTIDADQNLREEVDLRRQQIAAKAAALVEPGNVILIDGGPIARYLALELKHKRDITVITNSVVVFDILNRMTGITLISTGGAVRYSSQVLVGPTAEGALKELRVDKLFLTISGITLDFGLSHNTISEVTVKQAMIRSAREVILLADHTAFGTEAGIQVAPLSAVHKLITDDALPPSARLDLSQKGIQVVLV